MLADGKAPPAPSYYGIIGKSERGSLRAEPGIALVGKIKKRGSLPLLCSPVFATSFLNFGPIVNRIECCDVSKERFSFFPILAERNSEIEN